MRPTLPVPPPKPRTSAQHIACLEYALAKAPSVLELLVEHARDASILHVVEAPTIRQLGGAWCGVFPSTWELWRTGGDQPTRAQARLLRALYEVTLLGLAEHAPDVSEWVEGYWL